MLCSKVMKANKLISMCLPRHHTAPMERHFARYFGLFWFFRSLTAGYKLPGIVRQTSLSAVQLVQGFFAFVVFRILFVTSSLTREAFRTRNSSLARPHPVRVCTLFLSFHSYQLFITITENIQITNLGMTACQNSSPLTYKVKILL